MFDATRYLIDKVQYLIDKVQYLIDKVQWAAIARAAKYWGLRPNNGDKPFRNAVFL
jgi:glycerol-3-phosphate dehydrogenase